MTEFPRMILAAMLAVPAVMILLGILFLVVNTLLENHDTKDQE